MPAAAPRESAAPRLTLRLPRSVLLAPLLALAIYAGVRSAYEHRRALPESAAGVATAAEVENGELAPELLAATDAEGSGPALEEAAPDGESDPPGEAGGAVPARDAPAARKAARQQLPVTRAELDSAREDVAVVVYHAVWCGYCRAARAYLAERGIRSVERDIEKDPGASREHRRLNPRGSVPTIDIDGQVLIGFDAEAIERALDRAAYLRLQRTRGS